MKLIKSFEYKKFIAFTLTFFLMFGISYAKKADKLNLKNNKQTLTKTETPKLKQILQDLIKQNEYMDNVLDEMKDSGKDLSLTQISSLDLTLNIINKNLNHISLLTKEELIKIQPISNNAIYAKTILSYATKMDIKVYRAQQIIKKSLSNNSILRDVPNSKRSKKIKGKSLLQIIKEQKAIHKLAKNMKNLKRSSKKLHATSKWLFIVAK
jgi:hypothetical protein